MTDFPNQNWKVLEETVTDSNSDDVKTTFSGYSTLFQNDPPPLTNS